MEFPGEKGLLQKALKNRRAGWEKTSKNPLQSQLSALAPEKRKTLIRKREMGKRRKFSV